MLQQADLYCLLLKNLLQIFSHLPIYSFICSRTGTLVFWRATPSAVIDGMRCSLNNPLRLDIMQYHEHMKTHSLERLLNASGQITPEAVLVDNSAQKAAARAAKKQKQREMR